MNPRAARMSALEVAGSLPLLRYWIGRYYGRLSHDLRDEMIAETALELVSRHRRNPAGRFSKWRLLDFSARESFRRVMRDSVRPLEHPTDVLELAVAPNHGSAERLRERFADELVEEALEEFSRETPADRRARDRETRAALGTSPDPLSDRWPTRPRRFNQPESAASQPKTAAQFDP